jgi:formate dehydrogenase major subunit
VAGLARSLGSGAMTNDLAEFGRYSSTILIIGSNTGECHPIIAMHVHRALDRGAKLIVIDPKRTEMAQKADIHIQLPPGYNIPVLNALMNVIIEQKLYDKEFVEQYTIGFKYLRRAVKDYTPEKVSEMIGVRAELLRKAAEIYATQKPSAILYAMGITQFTHGTGNVWCISNLATLTGNLGKEGGGVNPLRGQNNVQGACDMGALPTTYPGYKPIADPKARAHFEKLWECKLSDKAGMWIPDLPHAIEEKKIRFLYVFGENPVLSDPWTDHFLHALSELDFLVVQDIVLTETAKKADLVLPAACWAEKNGTFTNTSRRVQRVRKAVEPPGEAKSDWEIFCEIAKRLGVDGFNYRDAEEVWNEIRKTDPQKFGGLTYKRIEETNGIPWPCSAEDHPGTPVLYVGGKFLTPDEKAKFVPVIFTEDKNKRQQFEKRLKEELKLPDGYPMMVGAIDEKPDKAYPCLFTTGRYVYHYHTGTMTRRCKPLEEGADLYGPTVVEIGPGTAGKYSLAEGEYVKIENKRGIIACKVRITDRILDDVLFLTFHYWEANGNELTNTSYDPIAGTPELKIASAKIEKITEEEFTAILKEKEEKLQSAKFHHH